MPNVVAIPARNEEKYVVACIQALDGQAGAEFDHIVLFANNCSDATAAVARAVPFKSDAQLHVIEQMLPPNSANAGIARRRAMEVALPLAGAAGVLFTTDADGQVDADWLSRTLTAIANGADAVAGWAELNPLDWGRIPMQLHEDDARECAYDALCDEIHARLDPDPHDPWPRHTQNSGASIAVTVQAYLQCGGIPDVASGEDRALIAALRMVDAKIRHDPAVRVIVSGRIEGRAQGGMAETIRRRLVKADEFVDERLEFAETCALRARGRAAARRAYNRRLADVASLGNLLEVPIDSVVLALALPFFGQAWSALETASPSLQRDKMPVSHLPHQKVAAETIVRALRSADGLVAVGLAN